MTETSPSTGSDASRPVRTLRDRCARLVEVMARHPVLTTFVVALVLRALAAVAIAVVHAGYMVPDEGNYIGVAGSVASGEGAEGWVAGYGQQLYRSTWAFSGLLAATFRIFGEHRAEGQAIAAVFGAVTAAASARLALELTTRRWALAAGLLVACLPSSIFWSSLVLRESMVWATLAVAAAAIAVAARSDGRRLLVCGLVISASLLALGFLREQTLVASVGAMLVAGLLVRAPNRGTRALATLSIVVFVPLLAGHGPAGLKVIETAMPQLAVLRGKMSLDAQSAITPTTLVAPPTSVGAATTITTTTTIVSGQDRLIQGDDGAVVVVEESVGANVRYLPRGLLAVTVRPYPWEGTGSAESALAKAENVVWFLLYGLAVVGLWVRRRRMDALAYPVVCVALIIGAAAVTEGNLGTAFRHRSQLTWAVAVLAVLGAQAIVDRRRAEAA